MATRLGIFGGTFDPVHYGHLVLAEQCREQCGLDRVWFVPSGEPPHKRGHAISAGAARVEMLELALAGRPEFAVSRIELDRGGPSYTVETLSRLHEDDPSRELFFLMGADALRDFPTWRDPEGIAQRATIVAVNRGGVSDEARRWVAALPPAVQDRVRHVTIPAVEISSSNIRQRVRNGQSVRYLVPRAVEAYIAERGLYAS